MERLADILKVFIEKHLISSLISITGAIATYLLVPHENWILAKLGTGLFICLAFCICFLIIEIVKKLVYAVLKVSTNLQENSYRNKQIEIKNKKAIQEINEFVDRLSPQDKDILITFIVNGNQILIAFDCISNFDCLLQNTNIVNSSVYVGDILNADRSRYWITSDLEQLLKSGMHPAAGLKQYKIKDALFHDFQLVYKTTGKLGSF